MIAFVIGTRPEIIKISQVVKRLEQGNVAYKILYTNQHYDENMSQVFFDEFKLNFVKVNVLHENIMKFIYNELSESDIDKVVVQGDTRSAYYGALVAKMLNLKLYHIEAGLRTNDLNSPNPEEFFRQEISRLSDIDFCPTESNAKILKHKESFIKNRVVVCGNPVIQALKSFNLEYTKQNKCIVTIHRNENRSKIKNIVSFIKEIAKLNPEIEFKVVLHPNNILKDALGSLPRNCKKIQPLGYKEFLQELAESKFAITDSGGLQEECCEFKTMCYVLRRNTERPEAVDMGFSILLNPESKIGMKLVENNNKAKNPYYNENCLDKIFRELK